MTITTDEDGLYVILHGREQLWALRAKLQINRDDITNIRYMGVFDEWCKWEVRMPGASVPGHLVAGSYWTEEGWDFVYIIDPRGFVKPKADNVIVIETDQSRYKRIILSYDKVEAERIITWWKKK
jgi:hypothetical protein